MIFSTRTIQVLDNFSNINQSLVFKPNILSTVDASSDSLKSPRNNIIGFYILPENENIFTYEIPIFNLKMFLKALKEFSKKKKFDINIKSKYIEISGNDTEKIHYIYSDIDSVTPYPKYDKISKLNDFPIKFNILKDNFDAFKKMSSILNCDIFVLKFKDDIEGILRTHVDIDSNLYKINLGKNTSNIDKNTHIAFKLSSLSFIPGNYQVEIIPDKIAKFTSLDDNNLIYFVALRSK